MDVLMLNMVVKLCTQIEPVTVSCTYLRTLSRLRQSDLIYRNNFEAKHAKYDSSSMCYFAGGYIPISYTIRKDTNA